MRPDHNRNWLHAVLYLNSEGVIFNSHSSQTCHLSCGLGNHFTFLWGFFLTVLPYLSYTPVILQAFLK